MIKYYCDLCGEETTNNDEIYIKKEIRDDIFIGIYLKINIRLDINEDIIPANICKSCLIQQLQLDNK